MVLLCQQSASALFDSASIISYIFIYFSPRLDVKPETLATPLYVLTVVGDSLVVDQVYRYNESLSPL